jgi:hypothetical protein
MRGFFASLRMTHMFLLYAYDASHDARSKDQEKRDP